ncbi:putative mitochondrial protein, partial [Mucuna pruriens]
MITPHLLDEDRKSNISYFHVFGYECFILNTKNHLGKFDFKLNKGTFLGYFETSKAYRVYNSRTLTVEESIHINFNNSKPNKELSKLDDSFVGLDLEKKNVDKALLDNGLVHAMKEELDQFQKIEVWELVPRPEDKSMIRTKWVFRNKHGENCKIIRNKASWLYKAFRNRKEFSKLM